MHRVIHSYRRIVDEDLPLVRTLDGTMRTPSERDLLNMGIVRVAPELYACVEQYESSGMDDATGDIRWVRRGAELPGMVLSQGLRKARHDGLPPDVRPQIMRAEVIRSTDRNLDVRKLAAETLAEVAAVLDEHVGAPAEGVGISAIDATDPTNADAVRAEVRRMADNPDLPAERARIAMADVSPTDVVEAEGLIPHAWAGEPIR